MDIVDFNSLGIKLVRSDSLRTKLTVYLIDNVLGKEKVQEYYYC